MFKSRVNVFIHRLALIFIIICFSGCHDSDKNIPAPLFDNLGNYHHLITTRSPLAQRYFDQGLVLFYSFEYNEAIRSFRAAVKTDPQCAMCYWGLALALGSKTDAPLNGHELKEAKSAIKSAAKFVKSSNIQERAYIAALTTRHLTVPAQTFQEIAGICSSYSLVSGSYAKEYANQMRRLMAFFPNDADAKTLYAASLFDVTEWNFWNKQGKPNPHTQDIINTLETAIAQNNEHPGANHLYVHIIEFSSYPPRAIASAERLPHLVPGSEHIAHMPCHTYFSLGRYHEASTANQQAINIYKNYVKICKSQGFEPEIQYLYYHNYDYLVASASTEGRKEVSISASKSLAKLSEPIVEKNLYLQKWLTSYILTLARFGEWTEILRVPQPSAKFQYALGIWHYAHALAEIQFQQIDAAKKDLASLNEFIEEGPNDKSLGKLGHGLLQIGAYIIEGVLAEQAGEHSVMIEKFKAAIKLQDDISSEDPPSWYFPVRQLLGTALLKNGKLLEAKQVFTEDLKNHPNNGWSLFGLMQTERALSHQGVANKLSQEFNLSWKYADIKEPIYPIK